MITTEQAITCDQDSFLEVEGLFSEEEVGILLEAVEQTIRIEAHTFELKDTVGRASRLSLWSDIGDDLFGR